MKMSKFISLGATCFYCGEDFYDDEAEVYDTLSATTDHVIPRTRGGSDDKSNLVLACRSCNSAKGTKSLDDFRFWCGMEEFKKAHGVCFSKEQYAFLKSLGVDIGFRPHEFAQERQEREIKEICLDNLKPENIAKIRARRQAAEATMNKYEP